MKAIEEFIASVKDVRYTSASGPVLDICRELAKVGRFSEIAVVLTAWVHLVPQSEPFLRSSLPAIILNSYIANKGILAFEHFTKWANSEEWSKQIARAALDESALQHVVEEILKSMAEFARSTNVN
jgi:hypothetical protein